MNISHITWLVATPYLIVFGIAFAVAFINIIDDWSMFRVRVGLGLKILFALLNAVIAVGVFHFLSDSAVLKGFSTPCAKAAYAGFVWVALIRSRMIDIGKRGSEFSVNFDKLYGTIMGWFNQLINETTREFVTDTKNRIAKKHTAKHLYKCICDAVEDDPILNKPGNETHKEEIKSRIHAIYTDPGSDEVEKAKTLAKAVIDLFPGMMQCLNRECSSRNRRN